MAGLVPGTLWMNQRLTRTGSNTPPTPSQKGIRTLLKIEFSCVIYSFILPVIFLLISNLKTPVGIFIGVELLFPILTIITGFFVGAEFPLGNKLYLGKASLGDSHQVGKVAGGLYGVDLFGACLGGLLSTIIFIPILGIFQTCFICGLLKVASFILILRLRKKGV